jgi:glycosyltransferase involved in cell wall biosynthesis
MVIRSSMAWGQPPEMGNPVAVDVLVPTCDRPAELAVTLAGLAAQSDPDFCVFVSDQSRGEAAWLHPAAAAMVRVLQAQGRKVSLLRHIPRRGLAEHRQFLLEQSTADRCMFLDDDVWLEPGALERLREALDLLKCGFVGMAPQGLSYLADKRPEELAAFEAWDGPVQPERVRPGTPAFDRWPLHNAANLSHLSAELRLKPGEWRPYRVAWLGGCTMFRRGALNDAGGFRFWPLLGPHHSGEDVLAQWQVMEKFGGAGILPSGAVHLESPTTVADRRGNAYEVVLDQARPTGTDYRPTQRRSDDGR